MKYRESIGNKNNLKLSQKIRPVLENNKPVLLTPDIQSNLQSQDYYENRKKNFDDNNLLTNFYVKIVMQKFKM